MATSHQAPKDYATLCAVLTERAPAMPKRLKQCAVFALAHPQDMALATVAEIAERAEVQPSALVRFSQALGYTGFSQLQRVFRDRLTERGPDYRARLKTLDAAHLSGSAAVLDGLVETAIASLLELRDGFDPTALDGVAARLAAADTIYVTGARRSYPVAAYLGYVLVRLGVRAHVVDGVGGMQPELARLVRPNDATLAISVTPYAPETLAFAQASRDQGAAVVAMTDGPLSPIIPLASSWLEINEASFGGFRSASASFCLAMTLAVAIGAATDGSRGKPKA